MLRVLGKAASINVRKVLWTLDEVGLAHEREDWGSGFRPTTDPAFLALNPRALVPVLVDGDTVLVESNTICRYLAAKAGRHDLLPAGPAARAAVEQWMDWQASDFNNSWRYAFMGLVRNSPDHADPALIARSVEEWTRNVGFVAGQLARTGAYVAGDAFTLADIVIGLSVGRWLRMPFDKEVPAEISAYLARLEERPAFRRHGAFI
ncbi:MAG TPA: glutathione S-transferase [Azospirillaceae bacterium]|nr:glutathione S-transferase [Azospirillaceae bacterium]